MTTSISKVVLIVLDSVGCGDAPDAAQFGDEGSNMLGNIARAVGGLKLPHLQQIRQVATFTGLPRNKSEGEHL